jgi:hypothetical protein
LNLRPPRPIEVVKVHGAWSVPGALYTSCVSHVAFMSRGVAVNLWKSLEINENICDIMQHQFVGPSSTKFLILLVRTAGLEPAQGFPQGILRLLGSLEIAKVLVRLLHSCRDQAATTTDCNFFIASRSLS